MAGGHEGTKQDCINKDDHVLYDGECIDFENAILILNLMPDFYDLVEEYKLIGITQYFFYINDSSVGSVSYTHLTLPTILLV